MRITACTVAALLAVITRSAHAQCIYVTGAAPLGTHRTEVVLVRDAGQTTMTIASGYDGPAQPFAMVVPIDADITTADVSVGSREAFDALALEDAPRLVEYWEQDPCGHYEEHAPVKRTGSKVPRPVERGRDGGAPPAIAPDREFEIVVKSGDVKQWLMDQGYVVSSETALALDPLTKPSMRFVVAKVDPERMQLESGHASLTPLRVHFTSPSFGLRALVDGDLVVHALGRRQRYEVVNRRDESVPTNLDIRANAKEDFDAAYAALLSDVATRVPDTVVTEYAHSLETLSSRDLASFGADASGDWVVTRLHTKLSLIHI